MRLLAALVLVLLATAPAHAQSGTPQPTPAAAPTIVTTPDGVLTFPLPDGWSMVGAAEGVFALTNAAPGGLTALFAPGALPDAIFVAPVLYTVYGERAVTLVAAATPFVQRSAVAYGPPRTLRAGGREVLRADPTDAAISQRLYVARADTTVLLVELYGSPRALAAAEEGVLQVLASASGGAPVSRTVRAAGLSVTVPDGWYARDQRDTLLLATTEPLLFAYVPGTLLLELRALPYADVPGTGPRTAPELLLRTLLGDDDDFEANYTAPERVPLARGRQGALTFSLVGDAVLVAPLDYTRFLHADVQVGAGALADLSALAAVLTSARVE